MKKDVVKLGAVGLSLNGQDASHVSKEQLGAAIKAKLGLLS